MDDTTQHPAGTAVQFTLDWLSRCDLATVKRFANREGTISGYRAQLTKYTPEPTVLFPRKGRYKEVKMYEVQWRNIELVLPTTPGDRLPMALTLHTLRAAIKPLDSYNVAKETGLSPMDASRALTSLTELGLIRGHGDGGDSPLAERFQVLRD